MKLEEFIRKYPALDSIGFRIDSAILRESAKNLTITRTDDRMPTPSSTSGRARRGLPTSAYISAFKYVLKTVSEQRPAFKESIGKIVEDFDSMMTEKYKCSRYCGFPEYQVRSAITEAIKRMPENRVDYAKNLINERVRGDHVSPSYAANKVIEDHPGDLRQNIDTLKALESIHSGRSLGWKILHPFKNLGEWLTIRSIKNGIREGVGEEAFKSEYNKEPEKYDFKQTDAREIENSEAEPQAQAEAVNSEPARENVHVAEAEEPVPQTSEKTEEKPPVAPQKDLK